VPGLKQTIRKRRVVLNEAGGNQALLAFNGKEAAASF
jgi:hypothetical protein